MDGMNQDTAQVAVKEKRQMVADFDNGIFATSDSFLLATQMAKALAASTLVPDSFQDNWSNCLIAIEVANRFKKAGLSAFQVMQNMYIVYGRPSWSSKFLIAMINASGKFDQPLKFKEELKDGKPYACTAWTTLHGEVIEGMRIDMDIAKAEGWIDKKGSKWQTMPQLMLRYRAASFFASLNCPEITMGLYTEEEAEEIYDAAFDTYGASVSDVMEQETLAIEEKSMAQPVNIPAQTAKEPATINDTEKRPRNTKAKTTEDSDGQMLMPGF